MRADALLGASLMVFAAAAAAGQSALNPVVKQETIDKTICVPGYARGVRPPTSYTNGVKQMYFQRARINPALEQTYDLDYVIPLALGGHPRNLDNLGLRIREGENGVKRKESIAMKLQCLVCSGQVTLAAAQREILEDWQAASQRYASLRCHRPKGR